MRRRTKIVCTIGPGSEDEQTLRAMIEAGMDVARLNFSHGSYDEHARRHGMIRAAASDLGREIAILLDIQGPKIRTAPGTCVELAEGASISVGSGGGACDLVIDYPYLTEDLKRGSPIFICDGLIELQVEEVKRDLLQCRVIRGGVVGSRKGVSLPGVATRLPAITAKDIEDIKFGATLGIDLVAASFVRKAENIHEVRGVLRAAGCRALVIAKIENREALANIEDIIASADGLMVARGDLGVELPPQEIPLIQKSIINRCNQAGKPVITATEMLESMVHKSRPTRAEVTDVANAILDGTDATMLSAETAVGKHPVAAVTMMAGIASCTEASTRYDEAVSGRRLAPAASVTDAISRATWQLAKDLSLKAIVTATESGSTARLVAKFRPQAPIIAATPSIEVVRQLCLVWGVHPILVERTDSTDAMIEACERAAKASGLVKQDDLVAITAGARTGVSGSTNLLKIQRVT